MFDLHCCSSVWHNCDLITNRTSADCVYVLTPTLSADTCQHLSSGWCYDATLSGSASYRHIKRKCLNTTQPWTQSVYNIIHFYLTLFFSVLRYVISLPISNRGLYFVELQISSRGTYSDWVIIFYLYPPVSSWFQLMPDYICKSVSRELVTLTHVVANRAALSPLQCFHTTTPNMLEPDCKPLQPPDFENIS